MSRAAVGQAGRVGSLDSADDAELVVSASHGEMDAYAELYRRHAEHAWRIARRVADDEDDARDAVAEAFAKVLRMLRGDTATARIHFRPYLVVATRHAAVDLLRRKARVSPTRDLETLDSPTGFDQASDRAAADEESRLITQALAALPDRDQVVLWLLEVEDKSLRTAAKALALKPNNVAQIAMRARRRLRREYVHAHLRNDVAGTCRFTVEHLPAHLDRELAGHNLVRLEEHLHRCADCQQRLEELKDLGLRLRRALLVPSLLGARASGWWPGWLPNPFRARGADALDTVPADAAPAVAELSTAAPGLARGGSTLATVAGHVTQPLAAAAPAVQHFVAAASTAVLVLGLSALDGDSGREPGPNAHPPRQGPLVAASTFESPADVTAGQPAAGGLPGASGQGAASDPPTPEPSPGGAPPVESPATADSGRPAVGGPATETRGGGDAPAAAATPAAGAGPGTAAGPERATQAPGGAQPAATPATGKGPGPPAHAGPGHATGLDRAHETPAGENRSGGGPPGPPAHAGPGHPTGLDRAKETRAVGHLPK